MIYKLTIILFILSAVSCSYSTKESEEILEEEVSAGKTLAKELGADNYGMRQYIMAFLKEGPNRDQDSLEAEKIQAAHLANIEKMAESGKLVLAGPFLDEFEIKGIYLFNVASLEEARALTETDPAVQAGRLVMELHPWYGTAAIMKANEIHSKMADKE